MKNYSSSHVGSVSLYLYAKSKRKGIGFVKNTYLLRNDSAAFRIHPEALKNQTLKNETYTFLDD